MSSWQTLNLLAGVGLGATWLYHTVSARRGIPQIADLTQSSICRAIRNKAAARQHHRSRTQ